MTTKKQWKARAKEAERVARTEADKYWQFWREVRKELRHGPEHVPIANHAVIDLIGTYIQRAGEYKAVTTTAEVLAQAMQGKMDEHLAKMSEVWPTIHQDKGSAYRSALAGAPYETPAPDERAFVRYYDRLGAETDAQNFDLEAEADARYFGIEPEPEPQGLEITTWPRATIEPEEIIGGSPLPVGTITCSAWIQGARGGYQATLTVPAIAADGRSAIGVAKDQLRQLAKDNRWTPAQDISEEPLPDGSLKLTLYAYVQDPP